MAMQPSTIDIPLSDRTVARPMAPLCLAFMSGIAYARYFPVSLPAALFLVLILSTAWLATSRRAASTEKQNRWILILILAGLLGAARMEAQLLSWQNKQAWADDVFYQKEQTVLGTVDEVNRYDGGYATALLRDVHVEKWQRQTAFPGKIEVRSTQEKLDSLQVGDRVQVFGRVIPVQGPNVPTGMDMQEYRYSMDIFGSVYIEGDNTVQILNHDAWNPARGWAYWAAQRAEETLPKSSLWRSRKQRDKVIGMVASTAFGVRLMPSELNRDLSLSGLAHITSISGVHVTFVLWFFAQILKALGLRRRQAALLTVMMAVFYLFLVGPRVPTLRAVLMAFVFVGQDFVERRVNPLNSLALAAVVLLLLSPVELFLPSFQLSFVAVLVLVLFSGVDRIIHESPIPWPMRWVLRGLFASIVVTLGIAPFIVYYFHYFTWGAVLANLLAVPLTGLFLPAAYLWFLTMALPWSGPAQILGSITGFLAYLLIQIAEWFAAIPIFAIQIPNPGVAVSALFLLAFLLISAPTLALVSHSRFNFRALHVALLLPVVVLAVYCLIPFPKPLRIDFIALGQGDCTLIRTPDEKIILIDGGPPPNERQAALRSPLVDYLLAQGVEKIDLMILSHPQEDHIGDFVSVVNSLPVGGMIEGATEAPIRVYRTLTDLLKSKNVPRTPVLAGDEIRIGEYATLWILSPNPGQLHRPVDVNEKSVVALFRCYELDLLLTGDIGEDTEEALVEAYDNWDVDILKVPHHGGRHSSSSALLAETTPELAIIEVGQNTYGHPNVDTLNRLQERQSQTLRTDQEGTLQLKYWPGGHCSVYGTRSNRLYVMEMGE